jgi:hypothetical protein
VGLVLLVRAIEEVMVTETPLLSSGLVAAVEVALEHKEQTQLALSCRLVAMA